MLKSSMQKLKKIRADKFRIFPSQSIIYDQYNLVDQT